MIQYSKVPYGVLVPSILVRNKERPSFSLFLNANSLEQPSATATSWGQAMLALYHHSLPFSTIHDSSTGFKLS